MSKKQAVLLLIGILLHAMLFMQCGHLIGIAMDVSAELFEDGSFRIVGCIPFQICQ